MRKVDAEDCMRVGQCMLHPCGRRDADVMKERFGVGVGIWGGMGGMGILWEDGDAGIEEMGRVCVWCG